MKLILRITLVVLIVTTFSLLGVFCLALSESRSVAEQTPLSHRDIRQVQQLIRFHDPRKHPPGSQQTIRIPQNHINIAVNYFAQRKGGAATIKVLPSAARLTATVPIPISRITKKRFLNFQSTLLATNNTISLTNVSLGSIEITDWLSNYLFKLAVLILKQTEQYQIYRNIVQSINFNNRHIAIDYLWLPELIAQTREQMFTKPEQDSFLAYYEEIFNLQHNKSKKTLADLLLPMFQLASERSRNHDPVKENRSLLIVLGAWASGHGMNQLIPKRSRLGRLRAFHFLLNARYDYAQHFLVSAALTAGGDALLSDAVGLFKELQDSHTGGSGFSFADLLADRAGIRFAESAIKSPQSALILQRKLTNGIRDKDIMPSVKGLPGHMDAATFKRRFGNVNSNAYQKINREIDRRIGAQPLYNENI